MKTACYIEDGRVQFVLTAEQTFEKDILRGLFAKKLEARVFDGSFYDCRGGWVRQSTHFQGSAFGQSSGQDHSLIVTVAPGIPTLNTSDIGEPGVSP